jgi:hypothetical protein
MMANFDPNTLTDEDARQYVLELQNLIQSQALQFQKWRNLVKNQIIEKIPILHQSS